MFSKINKSTSVLFLIVTLAFFARLYHSQTTPPGLYVDEVSIAVNAKSIVENGTDEWGARLPLLFKAYGEYKLPVYIYSAATAIKFFGANDLSIRLPSIIFGTGSVAISYFLIAELLVDSGFKNQRIKIALLTSLLLAISPWHLQFSRAGFEAVAGLFFSLIAIASLMIGIRKKKLTLLLICVVTSLLAGMSYLSCRVFLPPMLALILIHNRKKLWAIKYQLSIALYVSIAALIIFFSAFFSQQSQIRFQSQSLLTNGGNAVTNFSDSIAKSLSFDYLFNHGDPNPRHGLQTIGELSFWQLPFLLAGLYLFWNKDRKSLTFLLLAIFFAALPVGLGNISPHALRNLNAVPFWLILVSAGTLFVLEKRNIAIKLMAIGLFVFLTASYFHTYYISIPSGLGTNWGDGIEKLVHNLRADESKYSAIFIDDQVNYAYFLWYGNFSISQFQKSHNTEQVDKFHFLGPNFWNERFDAKKIFMLMNGSKEKSLLVVPKDFGGNFDAVPLKKINKINSSGGEEIFTIYQN